MKAITQHIISLFVFLAVMFTATAVFAQEETTTSEETATETTETVDVPERMQERAEDFRENAEERRAEFQESIEQRKEEIQTNSEERRVELQENVAERKAALGERVKERILNLAANVSNRLDAVVGRMQNIIDRTDSRIEKLKERGVDTTEAEAHLVDAQDAIDAAVIELLTIDTIVTNAVTSEDPRASWQIAKTEYLTIKENIKASHTALRATIISLKAATAEYTDGLSDDAPEEAESPTEDASE